MNIRVDRNDEDGEVGYYDDRYRQRLKRPVNSWVHGNDCEADMNRKGLEFSYSSDDNEAKEFKPPIGDFAGSSRSRPIMDQRGVEGYGSVALHGSVRGVADAEWRRYSNFPYLDEGPSYHQHGSFQGYDDENMIHRELKGPRRVEKLEHDRAELLRKLDELRDQLSRSCDMTEKSRGPVDREFAPPPLLPTRLVLPNRYSGHDLYVPEDPTSLYTVNMQPCGSDQHVPEALYFHHNRGSVPYINNSGLNVQEFYPPRNIPSEYAGYEGSYLPQRLRRPEHPSPPQYLLQPYRDYVPGPRMDFNQSTITSHRHETFSHSPACSCLQCYKNWQIPPKVPHPIVRSRSPDDPANPALSHLVSSVRFDLQFYKSRHANLPHQSPIRQSQASSFDSDLDIGGLAHRHPRRVAVALGSERACHPIAGGAPFITCHSCFELLKLPRKLMVIGRDQHKLRCGACSATILVDFEKRGPVSIPIQQKQVSPNGNDGSCNKLNENLQRSHNCLNAGATNSCSDDYDNLGDNFQLSDAEPNISSSDQRLNFGESNERREALSPSSSFSAEEWSPGRVIFLREVSNSTDLLPKEKEPLSFPDSLHQRDPDNADSNNVVSRYEMGNKSECDDLEKVILNRSTSQQNSVKDTSLATEMEVSSNEFIIGGVSQDSAEVSKEEDLPQEDCSRSSPILETGDPNVFVNGQPISDHLVKKAEKWAGPIRPGNYWYDYQAGFWGVMGHRCLGLIPPFIEEFKIPLPNNCAAGNTSVFVNGRELHQKDLDLLAGRGLPTTRDQYYIIEISGRVFDENTGEPLPSLGKLAPTVEKAKHGFGMKVPRTLAQ